MTKAYAAENEHVFLFAARRTYEKAEITINSTDIAIHDSGCSTYVREKLWFDHFSKTLDQEDRDEICYRSGNKLY